MHAIAVGIAPTSGCTIDRNADRLQKNAIVAPVDMVETSGTPGKYFAISVSAGPMILASSGGGTARGRTGGTKVTFTPESAIAA
jgi:hypothetical protein